MCLSNPKAPAPLPLLPEAPVAPEQRNGTDSKSRDKRRRAVAAGGSSRSNILTSSRGVQDNASVAQKTLLGQ